MSYYIERDMSQKELSIFKLFFFYDQSTVGLKLNLDVFLSTMLHEDCQIL